jgi:3-hydroxyisobutyrate dehydrogenase-like beta-hydroxyacid dehydrogenase
MSLTIAIIAPGEMGSAVGRSLRERGAQIVTSLAGRSKASIARAERAGFAIIESDDHLIENADMLLSIVPPGAALGVAERLAPSLTRAKTKPVVVDCNAVSPATAAQIGAVLAPTGCRYVDAGIIGPPPAAGLRTVFYVSGEHARDVLALNDFGLAVRALEAPIGAASALKMSYAGITKGLTAVGSAMMLGAERAGAASALRRELAESQPQLLAYLSKHVPAMFPKAYRWVAEMEEIAAFLSDDPAAAHIYAAAARLYERFAEGADTPETGELAVLARFCREGKS